MTRRFFIAICCLFAVCDAVAAEHEHLDADLLVVGGTESGCAAAVQAARTGVRRIVLVNDIEWLGGQFTAEALGAIDENRGHGYDGTVPIPRSGLFREVIDAMESRNAELYGGVKRPGNTRVITTVRPVVAERVFRELLQPWEAANVIRRRSGFRVVEVMKSGDRVSGVRFRATGDTNRTLTVTARMTIDASDWGDVIRGSAAEFDFGVDARSEFDEPRAPEHADPTDMNPITWCLIAVQQPAETLLPRPPGYDPRHFTGQWGWIDENFAYTTRRIVDGQGFEQIDHPDVLLINNPNIDYPVDRHTAAVAAQLEAIQPGASKLNIVELTPELRQIVFNDAKNRSLQYLYYLQSKFPKFRRLALSDEFGTADRMPPKPYIRESVRLVAKHIIREQEVLGVGSRSHYAATMFPDAVFCWQFELDFHPTVKNWLTEAKSAGPWEAGFRGRRRFGGGGTGRAVFPLRSLVPVRVQGLLGAQKNLGYTSIVGSSCRLHDQSMAVGQAAGAVAAVSLSRGIPPETITFQPAAMADVWSALLDSTRGVPLAIWPFADGDSREPGFAAIQQLALRRLIPLTAADTRFFADHPATPGWKDGVRARLKSQGYRTTLPELATGTTRREIAVLLWNRLRDEPPPPRTRHNATDADGDGIPDTADPLPFTKGIVSWTIPPTHDGLPDLARPLPAGTQLFNFTSHKAPELEGVLADVGGAFTEEAGFGWNRDLTANTRWRRSDNHPVRSTFVFTRAQDTWQRRLPNGRYLVTVCLGDAEYEQRDQNARLESRVVARNVTTAAGEFAERFAEVDITDETLSITIGRPEGDANTALNWVLIRRLR